MRIRRNVSFDQSSTDQENCAHRQQSASAAHRLAECRGAAAVSRPHQSLPEFDSGRRGKQDHRDLDDAVRDHELGKTARQAVLRYKKVTALPVMAQPNAGQPKLVNMKVVYNETPSQMVAGVAPLLGAGAAIIGGCCGSTPDHIRAFRQAMDELSKA